LEISSEQITNKNILNYFENKEKLKEFILLDEEIKINKIYKTSNGLQTFGVAFLNPEGCTG